MNPHRKDEIAVFDRLRVLETQLLKIQVKLEETAAIPDKL